MAVKYNEEIADAAFLRRVRFKELSAGGCGLQSYGRLTPSRDGSSLEFLSLRTISAG